MPEVVELLHLSDLHISTKPRGIDLLEAIKHRAIWRQLRAERRELALQTSFNETVFEAIVYFLAARRITNNAPLPVLVSGDLAATGDRRQLQESFRRLLSPAPPPDPELPPEQLGLISELSLVLPGNHDRYSAFRLVPPRLPWHPGCMTFDSIFNGYWISPVHTFLLPNLVGGRRIAIVAADLCLRSASDALPSTWGSALGQGRLYDDTRVALEEHTKELRRQFRNIEVMWTVHFSPLVLKKHEALELLNDGDLLEAAQRNWVNHLFCGHTHEPRRFKIGRKRVLHVHVSGSASAAVPDDRNSFFIHRMTKADERIEVSTLTYCYDSLQAQFKLGKTPKLETLG